MNRDDPAWAAHAMRNLDEHVRNAQIAQADNVIDMREHCERMQLNGHEVTMPFPFHIVDDEE